MHDRRLEILKYWTWYRYVYLSFSSILSFNFLKYLNQFKALLNNNKFSIFNPPPSVYLNKRLLLIKWNLSREEFVLSVISTKLYKTSSDHCKLQLIVLRTTSLPIIRSFSYLYPFSLHLLNQTHSTLIPEFNKFNTTIDHTPAAFRSAGQ